VGRTTQINAHEARAIRHPGPPALCAADPAPLSRFTEKLLGAAELATITERITACRDPRHNEFLERAVNGHADLIVSGDADPRAQSVREIPIVTPATLVQGVAR
jgi:predicted nucleic acid-binding protein